MNDSFSEELKKELVKQAVKSLEDPFKMLTVKDVAKDLYIGENKTNEIFNRADFPNEGRKCEYEGTSSKDFYRYRDGQQKIEGRITNNNIRVYGERISNYEGKIARFRGRANFEIQKNKMENKVDSIFSGIIAISNMVSNPQINNRPKRRIRGYRTLSKQAMKEYAIKQANSSSFDWFDEEEDEM